MGAGDAQRPVFCVKTDAKKLHQRCVGFKFSWIINPMIVMIVMCAIPILPFKILVFLWLRYWNASMKKTHGRRLKEHQRVVGEYISTNYEFPPHETVVDKRDKYKGTTKMAAKAARIFIVAVAFAGGAFSGLLMLFISGPVFSFVKRTIFLTRRDLNKVVAIQVIKDHYAKK